MLLLTGVEILQNSHEKSDNTSLTWLHSGVADIGVLWEVAGTYLGKADEAIERVLVVSD